MNKNFLDRVVGAIEATERSGLLNDRRSDGLSGLSGHKTVGLLQRLAHLFSDCPDACYLEVGVFQGLSLVSVALEASSMPVFGVDNFATLDPNGKNLSVVRERMDKFRTDNATLINADFEQALEKLELYVGERKIGVYFVDGPHDYRSQLVCLLLAKPHLRDDAIIVIDDANYPDVRRATRDFLVSHPDFKLLFQAYSPGHPANMERSELAKWEAGWLNGIHVLVRDSGGILPIMLPPVSNDRTLHFNEWLINRVRLAELAPEALLFADAVCTGNKDAERKARDTLLKAYSSDKTRFDNRLPDRNVYSDGLSNFQLNVPN